jgi:hypothetical protein
MMPMPAQCKCSDADMCPDDPPPPCDELKRLAWACQERCPPCGESFDCLPDPCPAPVTADRAIDHRSVQQGALSQAVRQERQKLLESRAPSGPSSGTAPGPGAQAGASGTGASPEQLDRRSVQQGGQ